MPRTLETTCCIAGGGPAGMMLGFLLARAGIDVVVLEKHADFLRDFRGDTIHPSTLDLMAELDLLEAFLKLPHQEVTRLYAQIGPDRVRLADFSRLSTRCRFLAFMPQWDFLDFIADRARAFPSFRLMMRTEATGAIEEAGRVAGVRARDADGDIDIHAQLTVGADGRRSTLRGALDAMVVDLGAPMDVLWFRVSRSPAGDAETFGHAEAGRMLIMLDRGDYWQCAYLIRKDGFADVKAAGLPALRAEILKLSPFLGDRVAEVDAWEKISLLTVTVDRLPQWWRDGLLCIGDAAHAMSPIAGVGINLAIQDAVATANLLAGPLARRRVTTADLAAVQKRREFPTRVTQGLQLLIQREVIGRLLEAKGTLRAPLPLRLLPQIPLLRRLPARFIGVGARPEHIESPAVR